MDDSGNSFFDRFSKTLMGRADADLDPAELKARNQKRAQANQLANSAVEGNFESFMGPPDLKGSGFGLQDIAAVISKLF